MLIASIFAALLVILSTFTHYEVLRLLSVYVPRIRIRPRARLLAVLMGTFFGHLLEISFYALAYYSLRIISNSETLVESLSIILRPIFISPPRLIPPSVWAISIRWGRCG